ncbi:MAG: hypothetical protein WCT50_04725 [Patescibacteria group bacterium]
MKNFFSLMNYKKPSAEEVLRISLQSPKTCVSLSQKGITFFSFDDWLQIATKGFATSPYAAYWRKLALSYPENKAVQELALFFEVIKTKQRLADQAKAILFSIPAKKLPKVVVLEKLITENEEQERIQSLLIRKKLLGDDKFISEILSETIEVRDDGQVSFIIENGQPVTCESDIFSTSIAQKRILTLFGKATLVATYKRRHEETGIACYLFFLVDGDPRVCKMRESEFNKITIPTSKIKSPVI